MLLGTLARFVKTEFEASGVGKLEFEKFELKRQGVERWGLISLELGTREAAKAAFAWLLLETLV